jgi:hypothetical protein
LRHPTGDQKRQPQKIMHWGMLMFTRALYALGVCAAGLGTATVVSTRPADRSPDKLVAHEWGTFTTVAGENGRAVDWLPLGGPTDLPCFVEHFDNRSTVKIIPAEDGLPLDYDRARTALVGRVRMETPVLYFYGDRDTPVSVKVRFPDGLLTEWYPHATVTEMIAGRNTLKAARNNPTSVLEWKDVRITPRATPSFPTGAGESHYYAARTTDAAPLSVGKQQERFLFYRGVADFDVPLSARPLPSGRVEIASLGGEVPGVVLFERRGAQLGFRVLGTLRGDTTVDGPRLDGSLPQLRVELQRTLVEAGLFPKEAAAMLETWHDSWFEDGVRVFYLVPRSRVDAILPLEIQPAPDRIARVFVGRMEVLNAATESAVTHAIMKGDATALDHYARFLGPIADRLMAKTPNATEREQIKSATNRALATYVRRSSACE